MESIKFVQNFIPELNSPEKIYELFRGLGYNNILDPSYKRKIEEFEFTKEERNKIKNIYTEPISKRSKAAC